MAGPLDDVTSASLPVSAYAGLAGLRTRPGVRGREVDGRIWLWWSPGDDEILNRVLPLPGVELFVHRDGNWFRKGHRLPSSDVASDEHARALASLLTPQPVTPLECARPSDPVQLTIVADDRYRPASALSCDLVDLAAWADRATTRQLEQLVASRVGGRVLLRGDRLPPLARGERWWGRDVLVPIGFRPEPAVPDSVLQQALDLASGDVALLTADGAERIKAATFGTVCRAGVRLAARERV